MNVDIKLASNHDLLIKQHRLVLVEGSNQKAQQIKIALLTFLGEWFLDTSIGVPYFEQVLLKQVDKVKIENVFRQKIAAVKGVTRVLKVDTQIDRRNRLLVVNFEAETAAGVVRDTVSIGEK